MPLKIVVDHVNGARVGQRQELDVAPRVRFGRHPDNEIAFDSHKDLDASTRHAELRAEDGRFWLVDVGSSNGTFVAGQKITRFEIVVGVPVDVEFGAGGPKARVFIGDPAQLVLVPATVVGRGAQAAVSTAAAAAAQALGGASTISAGAGMGGRGGDGGGGGGLPPKRRTMVMMVQHAMAVSHEQQGLKRSTQFMKTMVDQALHSSTKRFKYVFATTTVLLLGAIGLLVAWNLKLVRGATASGPAGPALGEAGPRIVKANHDALYLLAFVDEDGEAKPFCTGFAVAARHLASNAHCVDEINRLRAAGREIFAVQNGDAAARFSLAGMVQHPDYRRGAPQQTVDVALLELGAASRAQVRLAGDDQLADVLPGMTMWAYGFPGRLARVSDPEATLTQGTVGRVTRLDEKMGSAAENRLVQHSAFTMEGTSGSPVFDAEGRVIAVNTGSYRRVEDAAALSGYNVAIRIDAVVELMRARGIEAP